MSIDFDVVTGDDLEQEEDDDSAYEDDPWIEAAERRGFEKAKQAAT